MAPWKHLGELMYLHGQRKCGTEGFPHSALLLYYDCSNQWPNQQRTLLSQWI